ncbi:MAG: hypothetical protein ACLPKB_00680 [Xanthobacteraceae bacterium]
MTEDEIKAEMRLWALEVLVCNLVAIWSLTDRNPADLLRQTREQMIEGARKRTFPEAADPALSDLYSAELESAVARLMDMGSEQMRLVLKRAGRG